MVQGWCNGTQILDRNTIRAGQKLVVYVDPAKSEYFSNISSMSFADKQLMAGKTVTLSSLPSAVNAPFESEGEFITYVVRYGDTIWDIVKMFENVTTSQVLTLNNISDPEKIQVGQKLKIKKKS
jgi:membrane-bound lytic murein transglycosylase D